jgi:hypothetical protein
MTTKQATGWHYINEKDLVMFDNSDPTTPERSPESVESQEINHYLTHANGRDPKVSRCKPKQSGCQNTGCIRQKPNSLVKEAYVMDDEAIGVEDHKLDHAIEKIFRRSASELSGVELTELKKFFRSKAKSSEESFRLLLSREEQEAIFKTEVPKYLEHLGQPPTAQNYADARDLFGLQILYPGLHIAYLMNEADHQRFKNDVLFVTADQELFIEVWLRMHKLLVPKDVSRLQTIQTEAPPKQTKRKLPKPRTKSSGSKPKGEAA